MIKVTIIPPKPVPTVVKVELELTETQAAILKDIIGSVGGNIGEVTLLASKLYHELKALPLPNAIAYKTHNGAGGFAGSRYYDKA